MTNSDNIAWCCLNKCFGANPAAGRRLAGRVNKPSDLFFMNGSQLREISGGAVPPGLGTRLFEETAAELEALESQGCRFVGQPGLPELLRDCPDAPLGLYIKSSEPPELVFRRRPAIAVVGTRDVSSYGLHWCRKITKALAKSPAGPVIVSGLALGTDIAAHLAAMEDGASTIAVMPSGIESVYPSRHSLYADTICRSPGSALITDYPPGTVLYRGNFLRRNRIIAGLCHAVILIESRIHGGGMTTCRLAASYNRVVFALPGRADDIRSAGCNRLIADQVAEIVFSESELLSRLGLPPALSEGALADPAAVLAGKLPPDDLCRIPALTGIIGGNRGIGKDELAQLMQMPASRIQVMLTLLETEGFIKTDIMGGCSLNT